MKQETCITGTREVPRYLLVLICAVCLLAVSGLPAHAMRIAVSGAGTAAVNGTYNEAGISNGKTSYMFSSYRIEWFNTGMTYIWGITDMMSGNPLYGNNSESAQPPEAGWYAWLESPPAPSLTLLAFPDVTVSGAGTAAVNGTYMQIGLSNGKPRYSLGGTQTASYYLEWDSVMGYAWTLKSNSGTHVYVNFSDTPEPPVNGWFTYSGSAPAPTLPNIPKQLSHQGYLKDAASVPVNGSVSLTFKLYNVATGGSPLWSETQTVTVSKGIYSVILGAATPFSLPFNEIYYLGVSVGGGAELSPRHQLTSAPYALTAASVQDGAITNAKITGPIDMSKRPMTVHSFSSGSSTVIPAQFDYTFIGATTTVSTTYTQKFVGSAVAAGYPSPSAAAYTYGLCYRPSGSQTAPNNWSANPPNVRLPVNSSSFSISGTIDLPPGSWEIGFCVMGQFQLELQSVNGWVMATN